MRIMTAHAAKGLEFPVVFVPEPGRGPVPRAGAGTTASPPRPAWRIRAGEDGDEEDCLFFVALSRARETLVLSRSETKDSGQGRQAFAAAGPDPALVRGAGGRRDGLACGPHRRPAEDDVLTPPIPDPLPTYSVSALETYLRCPRQYHYKHGLKIEGTFSLAGYPQFHACVRSVLHWMEDEQASGPQPRPRPRLKPGWHPSGPTAGRSGTGTRPSTWPPPWQMLRTAHWHGHGGRGAAWTRRRCARR